MKSIIIPLVSQLNDEEQTRWVAQLNSALKNSFIETRAAAKREQLNDQPLSTTTTSTNAIVKAETPVVKVVKFDELNDADKQCCEVAIVANPDPALVMALPRLKWVQSLWAGVERLLLELPKPTFDIVRLVDPRLAETMAEAAVAWSYYLHRDMPIYAQQQARCEWRQHAVALTKERTVGVLGLGELGRACAEKLADNGFNVLGWSQTEKFINRVDCYHDEVGLKSVLSKSDIVLVLLPLTINTTYLFNSTLFGVMKKGCGIINFARGKVIDTDALIEAFEQKIVSHAVLDVFEQEPLPAPNELWFHPNVTVLPHISAPTNMSSACRIVSQNIANFVNHHRIPPSINIEKGY